MGKRKNANAVGTGPVRASEAAVIAGEIAGGLVGSAAGPAGAIAGMVIGAVAGTVVGAGMEADARKALQHDRELDEAIGMQGGSIGAARPGAPLARIGAFSAASSGAIARSVAGRRSDAGPGRCLKRGGSGARGAQVDGA